MTTVVIFGGTGFLGRRLARRLVAGGDVVRVAVRHAEDARELLDPSCRDAVAVLQADVRDPSSVAAAVAGADAVVNAVSAYVEKAGVTFDAIHVRAAEAMARAAAAAGVRRLVYVSGIGADASSQAPYIGARGRGEIAVLNAFPDATIVRPSAMFGPGDALFGMVGEMSRFLPALPVIGDGGVRLQPVWVDDVAEAIARILAEPKTVGRTYELGGPGVYTLRELVEFALRTVGRKRAILPLPFPLAELAARLFEFLPSAPLTTHQVDLLKSDNVAGGALPGFRDLGVEPKSIADIVPAYLKG
jgi:NADH dehydrogenase